MNTSPYQFAIIIIITYGVYVQQMGYQLDSHTYTYAEIAYQIAWLVPANGGAVLADPQTRLRAGRGLRIQKNLLYKAKNKSKLLIQYLNATSARTIAMQADTEIVQRIRSRIQEHGSCDEVDQLCLDGIEIHAFTPAISAQIAKCINVQYLTCNHCEIGSLEGVPVLPSIISIQFIGNQLKGEDIKYLKNFGNTQQIALDQNRIDKVEDFQELNSLTELEHIEIRGNPVCSMQNYRAKIFELIPKLKIVDCQDVFGDPDVMFQTETDSQNSDEVVSNEQQEHSNGVHFDEDEEFGYSGARKY